MNKPDELHFSLSDAAPVQRGAFRAMVRGLQVRVKDDDALYDIVDISATGFGMAAPLDRYVEGRILSVHFEIRGKVIVHDLRARIMRAIPSGVVACAFQTLTRTQEYALDKLVLEIQKRQIAQSRTLGK